MHRCYQGRQLQLELRPQRCCDSLTISYIGWRDPAVARARYRRFAPGGCDPSPHMPRPQRSRHRGTWHAVSGSEQADSSTEQLEASASGVPGDDQAASAESPPSRLFSSLNETTLRHEPGSVLGAAALVAGTTVGAGILALPYATKVSGEGCLQKEHARIGPPPACACTRVESTHTPTMVGASECHQTSAVVQDAGFVASSTALFGGAAFSVATGLLIAEVRTPPCLFPARTLEDDPQVPCSNDSSA